MADKYSVDDILAELEGKSDRKSYSDIDIDDILGIGSSKAKAKPENLDELEIESEGNLDSLLLSSTMELNLKEESREKLTATAIVDAFAPRRDEEKLTATAIIKQMDGENGEEAEKPTPFTPEIHRAGTKKSEERDFRVDSSALNASESPAKSPLFIPKKHKATEERSHSEPSSDYSAENASVKTDNSPLISAAQSRPSEDEPKRAEKVAAVEPQEAPEENNPSVKSKDVKSDEKLGEFDITMSNLPIFEEADEKKSITEAFEIQDAELPLPSQQVAPKPANKDELNERKPISVRRTPTEDEKRRYQDEFNERVLRRDAALENPEEMIDAINPMEFIGKAKEAAHIVKTAPKPQKPERPTFTRLTTKELEPVAVDEMGSTQGIAGNDLKELSASTKKPLPTDEAPYYPDRDANDETRAFSIADDEKFGAKETTAEFKKKEKTAEFGKKEKTAEFGKDSAGYEGKNAALVSSLNRAIAEKRASDIRLTGTVTGEFTASEKGVTPFTKGLNIDYSRQILPDTNMIRYEDPLLSEEKLRELKTKRKRKIRDFVIEDIPDEEEGLKLPDEEDEDEEETVDDDYSGYDTTTQVWEDLCQSYKALRLRFSILAVVTLITVVIGLLNDLGGAFMAKLFGEGSLLSFLSHGVNPEGYAGFNMVCGVAGILLCTPVLLSGIRKLFTGKADCDSICTISAVAATLVSLLFLGHENKALLQSGQAYIYISVGLSALLFNTIGKLYMIIRAKRNFRFISGDAAKYSVHLVDDEASASALTRGVVSELPALAAMRKTEFLSDFLKNTYCCDMADNICRILTPLGLGLAALLGVVSFFIPYSEETVRGSLNYAVSAGVALLSAMSPFSVMFLVNTPLLRASKHLEKSGAIIEGYDSAMRFSETNSVLVSANSLFPAGSMRLFSMKKCQPPGSLNNYLVDEILIKAASLAIESNSVLAPMFNDIILGKTSMLDKVDKCVYEDYMGILGWIGTKRLILGSREQMVHHGIVVPDAKKVKNYCSGNGEMVYFSIAGEMVALFCIEVLPNAEVKQSVQRLSEEGVSIVVKTTDSIVTQAKLADAFDISPDSVRILPFAMHENYDEQTKYISRASGALGCNGTFCSYATAITATKRLARSFSVSGGLFVALQFVIAVLVIAFAVANASVLMSPTAITGYNIAALLIIAAVQRFIKF